MANHKPRIYISKTEKQWELIDRKLSEMGRHDFNSYLRGQISLLHNKILECPDCICEIINSQGNRITRQHVLNNQYLNCLKIIEYKTGLKPSTIINELIISPLLYDKD